MTSMAWFAVGSSGLVTGVSLLEAFVPDTVVAESSSDLTVAAEATPSEAVSKDAATPGADLTPTIIVGALLLLLVAAGTVWAVRGRRRARELS
jgi:hypothetical protein